MIQATVRGLGCSCDEFSSLTSSYEKSFKNRGFTLTEPGPQLGLGIMKYTWPILWVWQRFPAWCFCLALYFSSFFLPCLAIDTVEIEASVCPPVSLFPAQGPW